jgi:hypothetical protein
MESLSVTNGDTVLVRYVDVSYCGTPNVNVDGSATVDCVAPAISNVHATNITGNSAAVLWDTNENSNSSVTYGVAPGPPGTTPPPLSALVTSHNVPLTGLSSCTSYVYSVASTDAAGNTASDNSGGAYYTFTTGRNVTPSPTTAVRPSRARTTPRRAGRRRSPFPTASPSWISTSRSARCPTPSPATSCFT